MIEMRKEFLLKLRTHFLRNYDYDELLFVQEITQLCEKSLKPVTFRS